MASPKGPSHVTIMRSVTGIILELRCSKWLDIESAFNRYQIMPLWICQDCLNHGSMYWSIRSLSFFSMTVYLWWQWWRQHTRSALINVASWTKELFSRVFIILQIVNHIFFQTFSFEPRGLPCYCDDCKLWPHLSKNPWPCLPSRSRIEALKRAITRIFHG